MKMRSEDEMMATILAVANANCRIIAAYLCGSRANPNVAKDIFRDYDIVFVVTETIPFLENKGWLLPFGRTSIVQEPDSTNFGWGRGTNPLEKYTWLMLFEDGNRIDLTICTVEKMFLDYKSDSLSLPLLDKLGILPEILPPSDVSYHIIPPNQENFRGSCNEFWWCLNSVAKGIARDELPYAMQIFSIIRNELTKMLEWQIGAKNDFAVSAGKFGKHFKKFLSPADYSLYMCTFSDGNYKNLWAAVLSACKLFHSSAEFVGKTLGFSYPLSDEEGAMAYLLSVKNGELY